jgi:hypothetical protein
MDIKLTDLVAIQDDVAAAIWRKDAAMSSPNVAKRRTRKAFDDQSEDTKSRWRALANAAIITIVYGPER